MDSSALVTLHSAGVSHSDLFRIRSKLGRMPESAEIRAPGFFHRFAFDAAKSATYASEISKGCGDRALDRLRRVGARVLVHGDTGYPEGIAALRRPPFLLYLRGELPRPKGAVSIVGSRKPTPYGEAVTRRFARSFIQNGWSVVSGGAYGVDSVAHREALDAGGSTIAIVGTGIDVDYPAKHRTLFDRMAETPECGIISCFSPETPPLGYNFPIRNALVAAYSAGTLVTEAAENSWSLITARLALDFNKEVFAVPGDIGKPLSIGTNGLIRDGLAKCVTAPEDVFSELPGIFSESNRKRTGLQLGHGVPPSEPVLRTLFQLGTANVDTVARVMGKSVSEIGAALSMFEIEGKAVSDDRGAYRVI